MLSNQPNKRHDGSIMQGIKQISEFEQDLHKALANRKSINDDTREEHNLQKSDNKNFGLINTIVNHNSQLKNQPDCEQQPTRIYDLPKKTKTRLNPTPDSLRNWNIQLQIGKTFGTKK